MTSSTAWLTSDLLGVYWIRGLVTDGILPVGTDVANEVVPPWGDDGTGGSRWTGRDFVSIVGVGGDEDIYSPESTPVYQIDCWSRPTNQKASPPWNRANQLAEIIRHLQFSQDVLRDVAVPLPYQDATVVDVAVVSKTRRVNGDPMGLARYMMDVAVTYVPVDKV